MVSVVFKCSWKVSDEEAQQTIKQIIRKRMNRCQRFKEELLAAVLHPDRLDRLGGQSWLDIN